MEEQKNIHTMTQEEYEVFKKLAENDEKRKECQRAYMRRVRQEKKDDINRYKRELYKKKKLERLAQHELAKE